MVAKCTVDNTRPHRRMVKRAKSSFMRIEVKKIKVFWSIVAALYQIYEINMHVSRGEFASNLKSI